MTEPSSILNGVVKTSWPSDMLPSETSNVIDMLPAIWKAFFLGIVGNIAINIANAADIDGLDPLALLRQWGQEQEQAASNALTAANSAQSTATSAQSTANNASTTANTANTNATNALSAAQNALQNAENALGQLGTLIGDVLGGQSTAADLAAFITDLDGIIDPSRIAQVSASAIGAVGTPNLLTNGSFVDSVSMAPEGSGWAWDGTTTHSNTAPSGHTDGSVTTTGTGVQQTLASNVVAVSAGQSLSVAGWLKWSGVTASSVAFALNVIAYLDGDQVSYQTIGGVVSPSASGSWQEITGTYTVPSGADQVRVQLVVTANVTAGQVWWDDLSLTKTQTIDQSLITDLENALGTLTTNVTSAATQIEQIGQAAIGEAVSDASAAVSNFVDFISSLSSWQSTTTTSIAAKPSLNIIPDGSPLWATFTNDADTTFPRIMLLYLPNSTTGSTTVSISGTTGSATVSSTPSTHSHAFSASNPHTHPVSLGRTPDYQPAGNGSDYTELSYIETSKDRTYTGVTFATGNAWTLLGITALYIGIYSVNTSTGAHTLVSQTGDIHNTADSNGTTLAANGQYMFPLNTPIAATKGSIYAIGILQVTSILQSTNSLCALLNLYPLAVPSGFYPQSLHAVSNSGSTTLPTSFTTSTITWEKSLVIYAGLY
ncbi:alanine-zipper protein [Gordonia sp. L191]|uniref:alanine-zipper protein n=1 Tax=Gordonia sp. L191 TaxID=2982699 RepID=UPI0024C0DA8F|nr:alanine-zipper protein [Gordonia sp. L191]WHU45105.1 alanine-zipper protein [Gordonia sp. L191]